jgi:hypothetical protein
VPLAREQYDSIFASVASGKSLASQLLVIGSGFSQFYKGLEDNNDLAESYARARKHQAESSQSRILECVDRVLDSSLDPNAARVAIDALKWNASRLHPAIYGEKTAITGANGISDPTLTIRLETPLSEIKTHG